MLLTAGLGTRLRPVTDHYAKPCVPFLNIPLLAYPLMLMREAGARELVINTHYKPEQVEKAARELCAGDFHLTISHEPGAPLGAGGGIWKARDFLRGEGTFIVGNGDEVILPRAPGTMARFLREHRASGAIATLLVMNHPGVGSQFGGVWTRADGAVLGFGRDRSLFPEAKNGYHYIGLLLLEERIFDHLPEGESNILHDGIARAIAAGDQARVYVGDFTWYETGNPHDFLEASGEALELLKNGQGEDARVLRAITKRYWRMGTELFEPVGSRVLKGVDAQLDAGAAIDGFVVLGDGAKIENGARVKNSVLLPEAHADHDARIDNKIIV